MPRSTMIPYRPFLVSNRRTRWGADDARAVLGRMKASGLSTAEFGAREGLDPQRLRRWEARLSVGAVVPTSFVEVTTAVAPAVIELMLRTGDVVRVPANFSDDVLRRVLALLDERAGSRC